MIFGADQKEPGLWGTRMVVLVFLLVVNRWPLDARSLLKVRPYTVFSADFGKRGMEENPTFLTLSAFLPLKRLEALRAL